MQDVINKKIVNKWTEEFTEKYPVNQKDGIVFPYFFSNEYFPEMMIYLNNVYQKKFFTKKEQMDLFKNLNIRIHDVLITDTEIINDIFYSFHIPYSINKTTEIREGKRKRNGIIVNRRQLSSREDIPLPGTKAEKYCTSCNI